MAQRFAEQVARQLDSFITGDEEKVKETRDQLRAFSNALYTHKSDPWSLIRSVSPSMLCLLLWLAQTGIGVMLARNAGVNLPPPASAKPKLFMAGEAGEDPDGK